MLNDQQAISSCPCKPLLQIEFMRYAIDMSMILYSHANKTHFYTKGFSLSLVLKVRVSWNSETAYFFSIKNLALKINVDQTLDYYKWLFEKQATVIKFAMHRVLSERSQCNKHFAWLTICVMFVCLTLFQHQKFHCVLHFIHQ